MHGLALREWAVRTAAWGVGVIATPSPRVVFLVSKTRAAGYGRSLFAPAIGELPCVHLLVGSLGRRPSCAGAGVCLGP